MSNVKTASRAVKETRKSKRVKHHVRTGLTLALGTGIPLLSLGMSNVAGTLATSGHYGLAAFSGVLMASVLVVSLPHLAWAIRDITGTDKRASWALAIAVDCAIVLCELVHVANVVPLLTITTVIMSCVTMTSVCLNCWAFLMARR